MKVGRIWDSFIGLNVLPKCGPDFTAVWYRAPCGPDFTCFHNTEHVHVYNMYKHIR